jgi:hypothetical protein
MGLKSVFYGISVIHIVKWVEVMGFLSHDEAWYVVGRGFASRLWQYSIASFSSSQMARCFIRKCHVLNSKVI